MEGPLGFTQLVQQEGMFKPIHKALVMKNSPELSLKTKQHYPNSY